MNSNIQAMPSNYSGPPPIMTQVGGQPVYVVMQSQAPKKKDPILPKNAFVVLASLQLMAAIIAIIVQIVLIYFDYHWIGVGFIGTGIWCGVFFGVTSIIGIVAGAMPTKCRIILSLVMSVLSACLCLPMVIISAIGISESGRGYYDYYYGSGYYEDYHYYPNPNEDEQLALNIVQILVALAVSAFAIALSALSCKAICCQKNKIQQQHYQGGMMPVAPQSVGMQYYQQGQMTNQLVPRYNSGYVFNHAEPNQHFTVPVQNIQAAQVQTTAHSQDLDRPPIYATLMEAESSK